MKAYLKTKDFVVSKEDFELLLNEEFDMLETKPQPGNLDAYYQSEDYISHTDANKSMVDKVYQLVKKYSLSRKVKLIRKYCPEGNTLLDFGAGTGDFLVAAKYGNWNVFGAEPNPDARTRAIKKGFDLVEGLDGLGDKKYDVITLWHVLEHLPDLQEHINKLTALLNEQGTLIIAVPNYRSFDARYYKKYWAAYDVPRHLWHFSKTSIAKLFGTLGLKVIKTKPMLFDAFYVALLSEKYKTGKQNYFSAFCLGLWSNLSAWRSKEYSSHIYILKRDK